MLIISESQFRQSFRQFKKAFTDNYNGEVEILYANKSNNSLALRHIMNQEGGGGDCFGVNEMYISLLAGTNPKMLVLNGSNKQDEELEMAIANGLCINIDSMDELTRISDISTRLNKSVEIGIRLALDLDSLADKTGVFMHGPGTLKEQSDSTKWGMSREQTVEIVKRAQQIENINLKETHFHLSRMTNEVEPFAVMAREMVTWSHYIKENTGCKVIFNGDGSDEVCCGYLYLRNAPNSKGLQRESEKLVKELYLYDVLRSDRCISSNGLEARTPFLDKKFVKYYLSIPAELKTFNTKDKIEKDLLRRAFDDGTFLPKDVLWRRKVAFSDGVSSQEKSWHKIIQEYVNKKITDREFSNAQRLMPHCTPLLKESYYYRKIFENFFPGSEKLIPHFWMPKWSDATDPSARELKNYKE